MAYTKINWQNLPSEATAINETNLNHMDDQIYTNEGNISTLQTQVADKVDKVPGKGLSTEDFTTTEKNKLAGIEAGANKTVVDSALSSSSENPVQNKVVKSAIDAKSTVSISDTLVTGDTIANLTINGTTTAIKSPLVEVDDTPSATSENPLQNKAIYEMLNNLLPEETVQGNPIAISDASGLNAKACSVDLLPIQDLSQGDPSPTNVCPISGRTQASVTRCGKNLFDTSNITYPNKTLASDGSLTDTSYYDTYEIKLPNVNNVSFSIVKGTGFDTMRYSLIKNGVVQARQTFTTIPYTITTDGAEAIRITLGKTNFGTDVQLELGSTATTYEPYQGLTVIVQLGQTVYRATLDVTNGKLIIDSLIAILNGTEGWTKYQSTNRYYADGLSFQGLLDTNGDSISNESSFGGFITSMAGASTEGKYYLQNNVGRVAINSDIFSTASELETYLSTNNLQIVFPLATPIEVTLTAEQISLLKGDNVISTDGDNIILKYSADIKAWVENQLQS